VCEEMGGRGRRAAQRTHGLVWSAEAALLGMSCSTPWKAFEPIPPTRGRHFPRASMCSGFADSRKSVSITWRTTSGCDEASRGAEAGDLGASRRRAALEAEGWATRQRSRT
jgi:hypothetical protein